MNTAINFISSTGSVPSFTLYFFLERKLVRSNPSYVSTIGCPSTLITGYASALIAYETDALTNRKVLSLVKGVSALFL